MRPARVGDLDRLRAIERAAGARFAEIGMPEIAADEPMPVEALAQYQRDGRAWVADAGGRLVGYVLVDRVDGGLHIEQLSVVPDHGGRGIGRMLIDQVVDEARRRRRPRLSLTTFQSVPWNGPYYERLGFRALDDHEIGPELASVVARETAHGLDPTARVCMVMPVE